MKERKEDVMEKLAYSEALIITAKKVIKDNTFSNEVCVSSILDVMVDIRNNHSGIDETTETGMLTILSALLAKKLTRDDVISLLDAMHDGFKMMLSNIKAATVAMSLAANPIVINKDDICDGGN